MARSHLSIVCIMSKNGSYFAACHRDTLHFCSNFSYTPVPVTPSHPVSPFLVFTCVSAHAYFGWIGYHFCTFRNRCGVFQPLVTCGFAAQLIAPWIFVNPNNLLQFSPLSVGLAPPVLMSFDTTKLHLIFDICKNYFTFLLVSIFDPFVDTKLQTIFESTKFKVK